MASRPRRPATHNDGRRAGRLPRRVSQNVRPEPRGRRSPIAGYKATTRLPRRLGSEDACQPLRAARFASAFLAADGRLAGAFFAGAFAAEEGRLLAVSMGASGAISPIFRTTSSSP